jgi:hypothetical protein
MGGFSTSSRPKSKPPSKEEERSRRHCAPALRATDGGCQQKRGCVCSCLTVRRHKQRGRPIILRTISTCVPALILWCSNSKPSPCTGEARSPAGQHLINQLELEKRADTGSTEASNRLLLMATTCLSHQGEKMSMWLLTLNLATNH